MTQAWAEELAAGGDPDLVAAALRLAASAWVTPERIRRAVEDCLERGSAGAADVLAALEHGAGGDHALADGKAVAAVAMQLLEQQAVLRVVDGVGYPSKLADAWPELGAPLWVFLQAPNGTLPQGPAVAIVGSRHPTLDGLETARELARLLVGSGVTIVSGMARGIDQAGHLAAVRAGGATVGVLGTGFGVDYPSRDGPVRDAVAAAGGLVTELVPGTPPHKASFLWRNRIIAGLADATVVVEGQARSGSLQTARLAAAQGRDVWAVPGSVRSPNSRAPLDLIRDGATPLTRLEDALDLLGLSPPAAPGEPQQIRIPAVSGPGAAVLPLLGTVPASATTLAAATGLPLPQILAAVGELAGAGLAAATPRGIVRVRPT